MTLTLEVEFLSGVAFAAQSPASDAPDWPPQPDRIFSALVASWALRGENPKEAAALQWLEQLPPPQSIHSDAEYRLSAISFVPPNDPATGREGNVQVWPAARKRQPRRFPAAIPHHPIMHCCWTTTEIPAAMLSALQSLAAQVAYIGHSASLTRCRFIAAEPADSEKLQAAKRRVYPGRFQELCNQYRMFTESQGKTGRPLPGEPVLTPTENTPTKTAQSIFSSQWLLLEHQPEASQAPMPDIRACAIIAKEIRSAILSGYKKLGFEHAIPEAVSGHLPDGQRTHNPHLAIAPLAFAGFPHADGHLMGFALIPPRATDLLHDPQFLQVLRAITKLKDEQHQLYLHHFQLSFRIQTEPSRSSLDARFYTAASRTFATATPIVLDRHLKKNGPARDAEIKNIIYAACKNTGLPEPEAIVTDKNSAIEGMPSAQPTKPTLAWTAWRFPESLRGRMLIHAVLRFPEPITGPVILGAGRFAGLGLCRAFDDPEGEPR